jgi:glycosyltransferase involved in cell wall biosynthesis
MRILHFLSSARNEVGGPARAVIDLCACLADRGHDVTLATCYGADLPEEWGQGKITIPKLIQLPPPTLAGRAYWRAFSGPLGDLVADQDLIHVHGMWDLVNVQLSAIARRKRIPYVISIRGMLDDWSMAQGRIRKRIYMSLIGDRWLRGARTIHLTARAELDQAAAWFPRSKGQVIPNLLDLRPFANLPGAEQARQAFPSADGRRRLLFLSRLHPKKGLEILLEALKILKDRGTNVYALVAGNGDPSYVETLKGLALSLGLNNDEYRFVGPVTGDLKLSLYESADVFVLPTRQENFGFVFIEALACGLPVITTTGVDIWPELESSGGALITDGVAGPLADTIDSLLAQPDELRRMGVAGRTWVFQHMNPSRIVAMFESMYQHSDQT